MTDFYTIFETFTKIKSEIKFVYQKVSTVAFNYFKITFVKSHHTPSNSKGYFVLKKKRF